MVETINNVVFASWFNYYPIRCLIIVQCGTSLELCLFYFVSFFTIILVILLVIIIILVREIQNFISILSHSTESYFLSIFGRKKLNYFILIFRVINHDNIFAIYNSTQRMYSYGNCKLVFY